MAELSAATDLDTTMGAEGELMEHQSKADGSVRRWPFPYHFGKTSESLKHSVSLDIDQLWAESQF